MGNLMDTHQVVVLDQTTEKERAALMVVQWATKMAAC
jgi:hypothetical protein